MCAVFGIHIGNTNASLAVCRGNGFAEVLVNDLGDRITPAVVTITDEETIVGAAAKTATISKWKTTIHSHKTLLNMDQNSLEKLKQKCNVEIILKNDKIYYCLPLEKKVVYQTPQNIVSYILQTLFKTAKCAFTVSEGNVFCVLLVPGHFSEMACESYKKAAETAGWTVLQIIHQTAAAVLAYSLLDKIELLQNVLIYRLGGTTCEVEVFEISGGLLYSLGSEHSEDVGGVYFTKILAEHLADEFFKKYKLDARENRRSMEKLKIVSENCIQILSKTQTANCFIESLHEGVDFSLAISRARFEQLIQPCLVKLTEPLQLLLNKLSSDLSLDKIIICGGATYVPIIQSHIASKFVANDTDILTHLNPDEVLALGATKQAYYLVHNEITEFLPRSMLIPTDSVSDTDSTTSFSFLEENLNSLKL